MGTSGRVWTLNDRRSSISYVLHNEYILDCEYIFFTIFQMFGKTYLQWLTL